MTTPLPSPRSTQISSPSLNQGMEEIDRISYMPEGIIYNVMDFLPTKEVARTSILSKEWRWRHMQWQHMQASYPHLDFDQKYFGRELAIQKPKRGNLVDRYPDLEEKRDNSIRFVDETLLRFHEQNQGMEEIDRISYMPNVIIYIVMDFLPTKEVVRTSILSKRWQHMQASYPSLDFDQKYFGRELAIRKPKRGNLVDRYPDLEEKRDNFIRFVDKTLLRFHEQGLRIRKFKLDFTIFESTMVSLVDGWIGSATESRVEELHVRIISPHGTSYKLPQIVLATSSLKALKLEEIYLEQLLHQSIRFHSLQKFSLLNVHVDARVIASIISSCPLIEEIKLTACLGLHKVHISGLHNLKEVDILQCHGIIESHIEAPSLQKLHYGDENREICPSKFNLIACQNLKWLSLHRVLISDQQFTDLISEFPLLEVLSVFNCMLLERVKISNQSLKRLTLVTLVPNGLEEVEIDAPNLQSVGYSGEVIPVITSTSASAKWDVKIKLYPDYRMNSQSFCLMRNLFAKGWNFKVFKLSIECLEISFNVEEIRDILLPLVPMVDHIELDLQSSSEGYSALLDGLLWSCHPKILSVEFMDLESQSKFIMALHEKIVHKFDLNLKHLESIQGWQHDLKDVEFHDGDGMPLNWSALSDATPNSQRGPKLHATFKW